jgi:hypothetical protein
MIRQAHTYLAGAVSGSALVGAAIVAFVLLVSLQALKDWPLAGIGRGGGESAVSGAQSAQGGAGAQGAAALGATAGTAASPGSAAARNGRGAADSGQLAGAQQGGQPTAGTSPSPGSPTNETPGPAAGGGNGASAPSAVSNPSGGGGSGGNDGGGSPPAKTGGGAPGGGGQSTSGTVTGAVNETVSGVDQTLGGGLSETGVTKATEEVVNGVAGPESPIGETLDKTVEAVGGLVGGSHR